MHFLMRQSATMGLDILVSNSYLSFPFVFLSCSFLPDGGLLVLLFTLKMGLFIQRSMSGVASPASLALSRLIANHLGRNLANPNIFLISIFYFSFFFSLLFSFFQFFLGKNCVFFRVCLRFWVFVFVTKHKFPWSPNLWVLCHLYLLSIQLNLALMDPPPTEFRL